MLFSRVFELESESSVESLRYESESSLESYGSAGVESESSYESQFGRLELTRVAESLTRVAISGHGGIKTP